MILYSWFKAVGDDRNLYWSRKKCLPDHKKFTYICVSVRYQELFNLDTKGFWCMSFYYIINICTYLFFDLCMFCCTGPARKKTKVVMDPAAAHENSDED